MTEKELKKKLKKWKMEQELGNLDIYNFNKYEVFCTYSFKVYDYDYYEKYEHSFSEILKFILDKKVIIETILQDIGDELETVIFDWLMFEDLSNVVPMYYKRENFKIKLKFIKLKN